MKKVRKDQSIEEIRKARDQFFQDIANGALDIPTAVKQMRFLSGLTQEQFARHRDISILTLKNIESGKANPTVSTLNQIGRIFGLKVGFLPRDRSRDENRQPAPVRGSSSD